MKNINKDNRGGSVMNHPYIGKLRIKVGNISQKAGKLMICSRDESSDIEME
jgi:hypothetical protein